jgi:hypothetical protein
MKFEPSDFPPDMTRDLARSFKPAIPVIIMCLCQAILMLFFSLSIGSKIPSEMYQCCDVIADKIVILDKIRNMLGGAENLAKLQYAYALFVIFSLIQVAVFSIIVMFAVSQFTARHYIVDSVKENIAYWVVVVIAVSGYVMLFFGVESQEELRANLDRENYLFIYNYCWMLPAMNFTLYIFYFVRFSEFGSKINKYASQIRAGRSA